MSIELKYGPVSDLRGHIEVSSAFESCVVFDVIGETPGWELVERTLSIPFQKDYDSLENPLQWPETFDVSTWVLISAHREGRRVGGAVGAFATPGVELLENRQDLVVLWDLRVSPEARRTGVGKALFRAVEAWGLERSCVELKVETQNVNAGACRLYRAEGCALAEVNRSAYVELPEEVQLIWRKRISTRRF